MEGLSYAIIGKYHLMAVCKQHVLFSCNQNENDILKDKVYEWLAKFIIQRNTQ